MSFNFSTQHLFRITTWFACISYLHVSQISIRLGIAIILRHFTLSCASSNCVNIFSRFAFILSYRYRRTQVKKAFWIKQMFNTRYSWNILYFAIPRPDMVSASSWHISRHINTRWKALYNDIYGTLSKIVNPPGISTPMPILTYIMLDHVRKTKLQRNFVVFDQLTRPMPPRPWLEPKSQTSFYY